MTYVSSHLKDMNRLQIYALLRGTELTSKAELARKSGISAPTVMKVVAYFERLGLVQPASCPEESAAVGRRPQWLRFVPDCRYSIGVQHEGRMVRAGLMDLNGALHGTVEARAEGGVDGLFARVLPEMLNRLIVSCGVTTRQILGIGLGLPAVYDTARNILLTAPLIGVREPMCLNQQLSTLESTYALPVYAGNDLNLTVLGEYEALGLEMGDLLFVSLGTGVGCGMMLDGQLRQGRSYQCGEIGYMLLSPAQEGALTLEESIGSQALTERFGQMQAWDEEEVSSFVAPLLAAALHNLLLCCDCPRIVLGGETAQKLGERLLAKVSALLGVRALSPVAISAPVASCPGVQGAAALVLHSEVPKWINGDKEEE